MKRFLSLLRYNEVTTIRLIASCLLEQNVPVARPTVSENNHDSL